MTRIFESVVAIKNIEFGSHRAIAVAEVFNEQTWNKNEWLNQEMKSVQYFETIVASHIVTNKVNQSQ
ncbi:MULTISPECIES: hypothetical protein [Bacillus]|uniref:hypothetical protein n=1 Tax=Bacillus TaxID=1386 RepID=UPI0002D30F3F|nr:MULTISPECIES: hypothetical protein [Bacillus]